MIIADSISTHFPHTIYALKHELNHRTLQEARRFGELPGAVWDCRASLYILMLLLQ